jgi:hypothetical protein
VSAVWWIVAEEDPAGDGLADVSVDDREGRRKLDDGPVE